MKRYARQKAVTWKVQLWKGEWFSLVLIGEAPIPLGPFDTKSEARADARRRASALRRAGR